MILYGASGHGKVVRDILMSQRIKVKAFFDDNANLTQFESLSVFRYQPELYINEEVIISIGNNLIRKNLSNLVQHEFGIGIHISAIIGSNVIIDKGTVVMQGAIVQSSVKVGAHVILNTASTVDHDCVLEDFVHVSPNATLCGNVIVGEGSHIGAGAAVIPNIKIGKWCTIGAGSVVINDIPDYAVVVGNPARIIRLNSIH
ncbi:acetyltransferase [Tenuifilum thalassicum]|uniref:Acetyltransferase n=1 Tax=Tenuifilum thalassicum TaxID=2590900 RepID=A0A7D3XVY3_9BACT|nr:acetyltransferase [Tenuifilum thalassicum]QKG80228.1 acetyltransferase [Tenuifilum thalassicum]